MAVHKLLLVAVMAEALWETCKLLWRGNQVSIDRVGAVIFGVFLCLATRIDFLELVGMPIRIPFAGMVLSGLLVSRGANFVHDLLILLENVKLRMMLPTATRGQRRWASRPQKRGKGVKIFYRADSASTLSTLKLELYSDTRALPACTKYQSYFRRKDFAQQRY